jgi:hypothetical protein
LIFHFVLDTTIQKQINSRDKMDPKMYEGQVFIHKATPEGHWEQRWVKRGEDVKQDGQWFIIKMTNEGHWEERWVKKN